MNKPNLLLECDDSLLCQANVKTQEDVKKYRKQGYKVALTAQSFMEEVKVEPLCVYYGKVSTFSPMCLYYNNETMAAVPLDNLALLLLGCPIEDYTIETARQVVKTAEEEVSEKNYRNTIRALPGKAKFKYFQHIAHKNVPGLYQIFLTTYCSEDRGFGGLDADTWDAIISSKTTEDKEKTAEAVKNLPDEVTIYRGGNIDSLPYDQGYSWTTDINIAKFFALRAAFEVGIPHMGDGPGYIAKGRVKKADIIEYSPGGEEEVIASPSNIEIVEVIDLPGCDFIKQVSNEVANTYLKYKKKLATLKFVRKSDVHGPEHELRVLIYALILSRNLSAKDIDRLATAAIYHDTKRSGDGEEPGHGKKARDYYQKSVSTPDPIVEFLCEYHSLPDDEGYAQIERNSKLKRDKEHVTLLYKMFKDADYLDCVRRSKKEKLDMHQFRLKESKSLILVAVLLQEYEL